METIIIIGMVSLSLLFLSRRYKRTFTSTTCGYKSYDCCQECGVCPDKQAANCQTNSKTEVIHNCHTANGKPLQGRHAEKPFQPENPIDITISMGYRCMQIVGEKLAAKHSFYPPAIVAKHTTKVSEP
ncbi:MAG: hypothetical protein JXO49_08705 [Deltaproteobacteria bacterium]|nr:hypothetical protein [Candidatus Anaeroferrophillus wilburensis]MBN2889408.1 hypothetical protein [Deltaproteobacteria bacterium]